MALAERPQQTQEHQAEAAAAEPLAALVETEETEEVDMPDSGELVTEQAKSISGDEREYLTTLVGQVNANDSLEEQITNLRGEIDARVAAYTKYAEYLGNKYDLKDGDAIDNDGHIVRRPD